MQPKPKNPSVDKSELYRALAASRSSFVSTGVFSFFINVLMLAPIIYMLEIYDRVLTSRNELRLDDGDGLFASGELTDAEEELLRLRQSLIRAFA